MRFDDLLSRTFIDQTLRRPEGRRRVLNQVADAEASSEGDIFDRLLARVDDPELQKMIRKHQQDEVTHARLFRERLQAHGGTAEPVPSDLKVIDRIDRALGGFMNDPIVDDAGVARAYLVLQVLEERALTQFPLFRDGFRRAGDEATAQVFERVIADEERHVRYCQAISRRYAPDALTLQRQLQRYREIESRAFTENSRANLRYLVATGCVDVGLAGTLAWLSVAALTERLGTTRPTLAAAAQAA